MMLIHVRDCTHLSCNVYLIRDYTNKNETYIATYMFVDVCRAFR